MPILNTPDEIRAQLKDVSGKNIAIPCFCTENTWTTEGILAGAFKVAKKFNLKRVPVFIAVTGNYSGRQQLKNYTLTFCLLTSERSIQSVVIRITKNLTIQKKAFF